MEERDYLVEHLAAAKCLAKEAGDVVPGYMIDMALMHAQRLDAAEDDEITAFVERVA